MATEIDAEAMGNRIRQLREARDIAQADLATIVGVRVMAISELERGLVANPKSKTVGAIAQHFGVPLEFILYGTDPRVDTTQADEVPVDYDEQIREVAADAKLTPEETARLASVRQSIGRATTARLKSYAADIIEARLDVTLGALTSSGTGTVEPSRVRPGRTPLRR